jgi:predicted nucleic acid-binding protein
MLDAGPLSEIAHPRPKPRTVEWLEARVRDGTDLLVPEIVDYEVRRELLRAWKRKGLRRLDAIKARLHYVPIDTGTMLRAAELWAQTRRQGRPTADPHELDCDVILAAQAERAGAAVVTENVGHLSPLR